MLETLSNAVDKVIQPHLEELQKSFQDRSQSMMNQLAVALQQVIPRVYP